MRLVALSVTLAVLGFVSSSPLCAQEVLWQAGEDDGGWPDEDFVQENGQSNPPPGDPNARDDDWYFPGVYPAPIGDLPNGSPRTGTLERAFVPSDPSIRLHFNLPGDTAPSDNFIFTTEPINLEGAGAAVTEPRYGMEVTMNGVTILPFAVYRQEDLNIPVSTEPFSAASVGAIPGPGGDNIIELLGTDFNAEGGGRWMGFDFHRLERIKGPAPVPALTELALLALALAMIPIGTLILRRRQAATA